MLDKSFSYQEAKRRVAIAGVVQWHRKFSVDEPGRSYPAGSTEIYHFIKTRKEKYTIIIVSHNGDIALRIK